MRSYTLDDSPTPASPEDSALLAGLNPMQREAAAHVDGPLLILAGAGSGKTRVMTHRIAYLVRECGVHPEQIVAMTFTNKAAGEMRERVDELMGEENWRQAKGVTISTFHSLCARLLRRHAPDLGLTSHFVIYDDSDQLSLIKRLMKEEDMASDRSEARRLRGFIERMKNQGWTPKQAHEQAYDQQTEDDVFFYETYQAALREANCLDFGDLILGMLELFRADPKLAKSYSNGWRYVMVDEFQDTNPAQYELLRHFCCEHDNLAVVGDDDQAIYRWRGATVANILDFEGDFSGARVVKLEQNYRSTQTILSAANDVIQHNTRRRDKKLWTDSGEGASITLFTATDDREEAEWVAGEVQRLVRSGQEHRDFAVFYRTNAQARAFEEQLRFHAIPYQIIGGISFYAREEVKDLLAYLKVALNPANEVDLLRVINTPSRRVGKKTIEKLTFAGALPQVSGLWGAVCYVADKKKEGSGEVVDEELAPPEPMGWLPGLGPQDVIDPELLELDELRGGSTAGVIDFYETIEAIRDDLAHHEDLASVLRGLIERIGYFDHLQSSDPERAEDKARNVAELVNAIEEFEKGFVPLEEPTGGKRGKKADPRDGARAVAVLRAFLDRSALIASVDNYDTEEGAVTLMTVHGSKGLEFDTVFLAGMEDDLFPSLREHSEEEIEEERRLAYVAITRAERKLYITNARRRRVYGQFRDTSPSRFLLDIDPLRIEIDRRSSSQTVDYNAASARRSRGGAGGRGGGKFDYFGGGVDRSEWEFDQSPPMIRNQITNALREKAKRQKQSKGGQSSGDYDEFSQVNPYADHAGAESIEWSPSATAEASGRGMYEGCTVSHSKFGVGTVTHISGEGDKAVLTIDFPSYGEKKIVRKFLKVLG